MKEVTAVHVSVRHAHNGPSISTQIAALRRLLLGPYTGDSGVWFKKVTEVTQFYSLIIFCHLPFVAPQGRIPLVVEAHSADVIATLILLKKEVESEKRTAIKLTITGAAEAHLLAKELRDADVGVIVNPPRPFPYVWEDRRMSV